MNYMYRNRQLILNKRPLYNYLLSELASEWQRVWRWPCFDTVRIALSPQGRTPSGTRGGSNRKKCSNFLLKKGMPCADRVKLQHF